ncbi:hypothetical protein AN1V17_51670 [Vallitalea sediminicola]
MHDLTATDNVFRIYNHYWGVLDIKSPQEGANVFVSDSNIISESQYWRFILWAQHGRNYWYIIMNEFSGKCLTVPYASQKDKASIRIYDCHPTDAQLWKLIDRFTDIHHIVYYSFINKNSSKLLDLDVSNKDVYQYGFTPGSDTQLWNYLVY